MNTLSKDGFVTAKQNDSFRIYMINGKNQKDHVVTVKNFTATRAVNFGQRILITKQRTHPHVGYRSYQIEPVYKPFG